MIFPVFSGYPKTDSDARFQGSFQSDSVAQKSPDRCGKGEYHRFSAGAGNSRPVMAERIKKTPSTIGCTRYLP